MPKREASGYIQAKKNIMSSFDDADAKLEEIPSITLSTAAKPLAFVAPDAVEEALLEDIRKGKVISSEGINGTANNKERAKELEEPAYGIDDGKDKVAIEVLILVGWVKKDLWI